MGRVLGAAKPGSDIAPVDVGAAIGTILICCTSLNQGAFA
jgi:hypothetical protein